MSLPPLPEIDTVGPAWRWWAIVALVVIVLPAACSAFSAPRFRADGGNVAIMLYDEPCALAAQITNLPHRATWTEAGKVYEGCFGFMPREIAGVPLVILYFSDRTATALPASAFRPVTSS